MPYNTIEYTNLLCKRFEFGIPLEDMSLENDVHHLLKFLLSATINITKSSNIKVEDILRKSRTPTKSMLEMKDYLVQNQSIPVSYPPIAYFWVIRHFLGLLPLPLLSKFNEKIVINWQEIAQQCYDVIKSSDFTSLKLLDADILSQIRLIPYSNYLVLQLLLNFMRLICERNDKSLSKSAAYALASYFGASMFCRPFMPGFTSKEIKIYNYLLFYMIVRWNKLKAKGVYSQHNSFITSPCLRMDFPNVQTAYTYNYFPKEMPKIIKESSCQTVSERTKNEVSTKLELSRRCCCSYGSHYEELTQIQEETENLYKSSIPLDQGTEISNFIALVNKKSVESIGSNKICAYGWADINQQESKTYVNNNFNSSSDNLHTSVSHCEEVKTEQIIFEEQNLEHNHIEKIPPVSETMVTRVENEIPSVQVQNKILTKITNPFMLIETEKDSANNQNIKNSDMVAKVSKIGWTYTPPPKITKNKIKSDSEIQESKTTVKSINSVNEDFDEISSNSWSSLISLKKFRVKLDFLKKIKSKKFVLTPTSSSIKYKRLSSKSNTF